MAMFLDVWEHSDALQARENSAIEGTWARTLGKLAREAVDEAENLHLNLVRFGPRQQAIDAVGKTRVEFRDILLQ